MGDIASATGPPSAKVHGRGDSMPSLSEPSPHRDGGVCITWASQSRPLAPRLDTPSASVPFQSLDPGTCYPGLSIGQRLLMPLGAKNRSEATSSSGIHLLPSPGGLAGSLAVVQA